ncbi:hypothetical protein HPB49_003220 [Dermacentor silvarum]|uniref:Uncharacterized protein n=1 Tax=Dermacentor silvarum TaxID=543639 RepID=A0ACB8C100_DERSI|nr:hypothetical protein HPB49_003220 [Dermacentor silvarum]
MQVRVVHRLRQLLAGTAAQDIGSPKLWYHQMREDERHLWRPVLCRVRLDSAGFENFLSMAVSKIIGYDPAAMSWAQIDQTTPHEDQMLTENECLQALVRLRQRRTQGNNAETNGGAGTTPLTSTNGNAGDARAAPPLQKKTGNQWRTRQTPRLHYEDLVVVLKARGTLDLKASFKHGDIGSAVAHYVGEVACGDLSVWPVWDQNTVVCGTQSTQVADKLARYLYLKVGASSYSFKGHLKLNVEVCKGVINVREEESSASLKPKLFWRVGEIAFVRKLGTTNVAVVTFVGRRLPRYIHYNHECVPVRAYKKTIPACYRCGTIGHRVDNCPHPDDGRFGFCGQQVGITPPGLNEHECKPICMICGEAHLTGSAQCTGEFRKLRRPVNQSGGATSKQRQRTDQPPRDRKLNKSGQAPQQQPSKTDKPGQVAHQKKTPKNQQSGTGPKPPAFKAGDFPPLGKGPIKQSSPASTLTPSPIENGLRAELEILRNQNAQLAFKIATLENNRADTPIPGIRLDDTEDSASVCSGSTVTSAHMPFYANMEARQNAQEKQIQAFAEQMVQLPNLISQAVPATIQMQMQQFMATVTQQVTQQVKTWIQNNPKLLRCTGPIREAGRSSK